MDVPGRSETLIQRYGPSTGRWNRFGPLLGLLVWLGACKAEQSPFDYWVLAMSWSPEYCASEQARPDSAQCAEQRGFIVHGLWPQFERGHPEYCDSSGRVSSSVIRAMAELTPDAGLVRHQWRKHGSCSGLTATDYFSTARDVGAKVQSDFNQVIAANKSGSVRRKDLERELAATRSGLSADAVALQCRGNYLREVRVCLSPDLSPRSCGRDVRDRCPKRIRIR